MTIDLTTQEWLDIKIALADASAASYRRGHTATAEAYQAIDEKIQQEIRRRASEEAA